MDASGAIHAVWEDDTPGNDDIYYAQGRNNGTWSSPQNISNTPGRSGSPQLAVDESGTIHVVWWDFTPGTPDIYYARGTSDGTWSTPRNISSTPLWSMSPQLAVEGNGAVHVVWAGESWQDIYYVGTVSVEETSDSIIAQAVGMPITMPDPTLSFFYQLGGASATSGSWFRVQVSSSITATTLFSTTSSIGWAHRWFDFTPWAGQTVTMTFGVHQTAGQPRTWAYLDEVTLGSAYPDLWVSKDGLPMAALPEEQVVYTIAYGNRGGAAASGARITDTLPSELPFLEASPVPIVTTPSLVWDVGDLAAESGPFAIVVTATVASTATMWSSYTNTVSIGTTSPELETANNLDQAAIFVGRRIYLPLVMRGYSR